MEAACPDDLADALTRLLTDVSFELRALRDLRQQMTRPEDEEAATATDATIAALDDLARHVLPMLSVDDRIGLCCMLEWHWRHEWPRFLQQVEADALAMATMDATGYALHARRLGPLAERELARWPELMRRSGG